MSPRMAKHRLLFVCLGNICRSPMAEGVFRRVAEDGKVAIRNVRRDVMQHLKELVVNGDVGDDEERRAEAQVQKITDDHTKSIDDLLKVKEAEIMEV